MNALIIDDDPFSRKILSQLLLEMGHTVTLASNTDEGLKRMTSASFDLIICDVLMPGLSGATFLTRLEREHAGQHPVVVVISGLKDAEEMLRKIHVRFDYFLAKPLEPRIFTQLISKIEQTAH